MIDSIAWGSLALGVVNSVVLYLVMRELALIKLGALRRSGLKFDARIPEFNAVTRDGARVDSTDLRRTLLLFLSPDCEPCRVLIGDLRAAVAHGLPPLTVTISSPKSFAEHADSDVLSTLDFVDARHVLIDEGRRIFSALQVPVTPFVYVVSAEGRVRGSGAPRSAAELADLAQAIA